MSTIIQNNQVYNNEARLLEEHGIEVVKYNTSNDVFDNAKLIGKICITLGMIWSFKHYNNVKSIIKKEKPDIVQCKDCINLKALPVDRHGHQPYWCENLSIYSEGPNWFCGDGVRK